MKKSRLVQLLRTFSKKEFRELKKWLHSPMHNQREDVLLLFDYLTERDHLDKDHLLEKDYVYSKLFPKETYDDARMRQVMHFFLKAVEEYLIYAELRSEEVRAQTALARAYRQRQLSKSFKKALQGVRQLQEKSSYRNREYHQSRFDMLYEEYSYLSGLKRTVPLNLQEVSNALDIAYIADKIRQSCLMLAHQTVFKTEYEIGFLEYVLKYVETKGYLNIPAIAIYYYAYKATKERDREEYFQSLKTHIFEYGDLFPESEIRDIYLLAINYCIGRMNAGVEQYKRETFELYKHGLEKKILIQNGLLSRWTFGNIVINATMLKEFDWTERFIHDYKDYLEEQYRENVVHYSQAKVYFEKREYDNAMKLLNQAEYDDILLNLLSKTMQLKMYYELDEFSSLESLLESMRTYMRRKKVIGYHKNNYMNVINMARKLVNVNPFDAEERKKLREEIEAANPLTEKKWLLKQVDAMG